jgi:ATP-dependent DNA helicase RecG
MIKTINRIIIGDVGSGKTVVAFAIALAYLKGLKTGLSGNIPQVSMLAPTEILAYQHYQKLMELTAEMDWFLPIFVTSRNVFWKNEKITKLELKKRLLILENSENDSTVKIENINSKTKNSKSKKVKNSENLELKIENLPENPVKKLFFLGTQALLFQDFITPDMVLVDEQHRFGVAQRQSLSQKYLETNLTPHFLSFTATPIPRTLALTIFRDLKPHFLDTLEGRNPIETKIYNFNQLETVILPLIQKEIDKKRKIYIICPKIEDKEETENPEEIWSIDKAKKFFSKYFPVLSVHGKQVEKKDILQFFKETSECPVLIATTVIEVGVDIPDASMVLILNAERFGLAALHQIRGRVGRNNFVDNYCFLVTNQGFNPRLRYLCKYHNGFTLAQKDLELRGSGDLVGKLQSGIDKDLENLMNLESDSYLEIQKILDSISDFGEYPRLEKYLKKQASQIWGE